MPSLAEIDLRPMTWEWMESSNRRSIKYDLEMKKKQPYFSHFYSEAKAHKSYSDRRGLTVDQDDNLEGEEDSH